MGGRHPGRKRHAGSSNDEPEGKEYQSEERTGLEAKISDIQVGCPCRYPGIGRANIIKEIVQTSTYWLILQYLLPFGQIVKRCTMADTKKRNGWLTAWLIIIIIANAGTALSYLFGRAMIAQILETVPGWVFPVVL